MYQWLLFSSLIYNKILLQNLLLCHNRPMEQRALHFKICRQKRHIELAEDYTEMIADYLEEKGAIRVCEIAKEMGVSHVSVLKSIKKLKRDGLLIENHQSIALTQKGKEMAAFSKRKHQILTNFLLLLGVSDAIAAVDVEGIEHHVSPETLVAIEAFLQKYYGTE